MFENDICLCGNKENCPLKDTCRRAQEHGPGIYTMSLFYDPNKKECEYYWKIKDETLA